MLGLLATQSICKQTEKIFFHSEYSDTSKSIETLFQHNIF